MVTIGDCLAVMQGLPEASVDAIVTDPPYGLAFMGKQWDHGIPGEVFWREAYRIAKPGAHLLAFGGTRTFHRLACAIEDAGWEMRDCLSWLYGSGFPKSLDVSKAMDKAAGVQREVVGRCRRTGKDAGTYGAMAGDNVLSAPATFEAQQWSGWGTALKPAWEPILMARKPLDGTVAANVTTWGTGAINIDASRAPACHERIRVGSGVTSRSAAWDRPWKCDPAMVADRTTRHLESQLKTNSMGRWPANVVHDGSDDVVNQMPTTSSGEWRGQLTGTADGTSVDWRKKPIARFQPPSTGSAARFFYCAKASRSEREAGMAESNVHPTVKPITLMRWLVRMVTPPGGLVLDPFMGSGTTGCAAVLEGFRFHGIEQQPEYAAIAESRIAYWAGLSPDQLALEFDTSAGAA